MIQEKPRSRYLGVLCFRCKERIPVPIRAAVLYEELRHGEVSDGKQERSYAFTLRCKACDEESVYVVEEIGEFEGIPRFRTQKGKSARA